MHHIHSVRLEEARLHVELVPQPGVRILRQFKEDPVLSHNLQGHRYLRHKTGKGAIMGTRQMISR